MTKEKIYLDLLISRFEYFQDKKITELTREEIQEYMNLRKEASEIMLEVTSIWESIKPYYEAGKLYQERVMNK
jgi:hypothetical protein